VERRERKWKRDMGIDAMSYVFIEEERYRKKMMWKRR